MELILVRHGQPAWTTPDGKGRNDPGLTELGHAQAKEAAARRSGSVGSVIEEALVLLLADIEAPREMRPLPVFPGGPRPGVDINSNAAMWALLEEEEQDALP